MKSGIAISVLSLMIFFAACNKTEIVPIEKDPCLLPDSMPTYYYNGVYRQYILYKPDSMPANAPLLFVLHGEQHNAEKMYQIGFNKQADTNKFMICYPQALKCNWENGSRKTTDVAFLKILAQYLQTKYGLSTTKTYAVGYSSGGTMSNLLAIDGSEVFKATACVAGNLKTEIVDNSFPQYAIPTFTIHGTSDEVMPINGSAQNRTPSTQRVVDLFRKTNNCF